jgi:hypothetical protein
MHTQKDKEKKNSFNESAYVLWKFPYCILPESGRVFGHSGRQGAPSLYKQGGMTRPFSPLETPSIAVSNKGDIIPALQ